MNWLKKMLYGILDVEAEIATAVKAEHVETIDAALVLEPCLKSMARDGKKNASKELHAIETERQSLVLREEVAQELADAARKILGR